CRPASGSLFELGVTTVSCVAADDLGDTVRCSFTVTVQDSTGPRISAPTRVNATCTSVAGEVVTVSASAADLCDPNPTLVCTPPSGSQFSNGPDDSAMHRHGRDRQYHARELSGVGE